MTSNAGGKVAPDWERIEADYRAGILSVREIAAENGVSHTAINNKAKAKGWDRDLSAKIKAKADALVSKAEVSNQVSKFSEREIVETNAAKVAGVQISHRKDITRSKNLVNQLFTELETPTEDESLVKRVDCAKKLVETQKVLIALEREAYGIDKGSTEENTTPAGLGHMYGRSNT